MGEKLKAAVFLFFVGILLVGCSRETHYRVEGDSMLPTLRGEMRKCRCPYCGFSGFVSSQKTAVCTNCLGVIPESFLEKTVNLPGEVLTVVARSGYNYDDVVVALLDGKTPCVKRVAACPGDSVEIRDGAIYINGRRRLRTLEQWKRLRILVHDDRFRPEGISRWTSNDGWQANDAGWTVSQSPATLVYHHAEGRLETTFVDGRKVTSHVFHPVPVTNRQASNGTEMRSDWTFAIREFLLTFRVVEMSGVGTLEITLPMGEEACVFTVPLSCGGYMFSTLDGVPQADRNVSIRREKMPGDMVLSCSFPTIRWKGTGTARIVGLTLFRGEYSLPDLRNSQNFANFSQKTLAKDANPGYYLLGDNSLPSEDSRKWGPIPVTRIRGLVVHP